MESKVWKLLFIASSTIYPSECEQPISEKSLLQGALDPIHESYGLAKITGIKLCEKASKQAGCNFFTLVPTNIYGVGDHFEEGKAHVIGNLISRFHKAKNDSAPEVSVWGSWAALREFLYVSDMAESVIFFMENPVSASYINIGGNQEVSIRELSLMISEMVGYQGNIIFDTSKPEGRLRRKLDTTLASSLGWNAEVSLSVWLKRTYDYFLSTL